MYVRMDKLTPDTARKMIIECKERIVLNQQRSIRHMGVLRVLEQFEGKKITVRIKKAMQAAVPHGTAQYYKDDFWYQMNIWGAGLSWDDKLTYHLARVKDGGLFSMDKFNELNPIQRYAFRKANEELEQFLVEFPAHMEAWNMFCDYVEEQVKRFNKVPSPAHEYFQIR